MSGTPRICVKICGITNPEDAAAAIDFGADALGFNFFPGSKRYLDPQLHGAWIAKLSDNVSKVAVLVDPTLSQAVAVAGLPFIDTLQLHGSESPAFCQMLAERGVRFTKAVPVSDQNSLEETSDYHTETILLDSYARGRFGGSGETFPWAIGRRFVVSHPDLKVILAGGLTPENVADAVKEVGPFGVDVTSGVESSPGRKDRALLQGFFAAIHGV